MPCGADPDRYPELRSQDTSGHCLSFRLQGTFRRRFYWGHKRRGLRQSTRCPPTSHRFKRSAASSRRDKPAAISPAVDPASVASMIQFVRFARPLGWLTWASKRPSAGQAGAVSRSPGGYRTPRQTQRPQTGVGRPPHRAEVRPGRLGGAAAAHPRRRQPRSLQAWRGAGPAGCEGSRWIGQ